MRADANQPRTAHAVAAIFWSQANPLALNHLSFNPVTMNTKLATAVMLIALISAGVCSTEVQGQLKRGHKMIDSRMALGVASQRTLMSNKDLVNHVQPVRLLTPKGSSVGVFANGSTISSSGPAVSVGVSAGLIYRFKVDFIANQKSYTVYPSIELLDRLYPPKGLETQFPIPVVLTQNDLEQASAGKMVTKVIYLESAEGAVVRRGSDREQPYFDVDGSEDPLHVAKGFGKPLVILRIGSRIPIPEELNQPSAFNSSMPVSLPDPVEIANPTKVFSTQIGDQSPQSQPPAYRR